jgi:site-specific recombinase
MQETCNLILRHNTRTGVSSPAWAQRWARWGRDNVTCLAANVSLGLVLVLVLGLGPALAALFALLPDVRHVPLSTAQFAAAADALGVDVLRMPAFGWYVGCIVAAGVLTLAVSFYLTFKVALRSRRIPVRERQRIGTAIRRRQRQAPLTFLLPPRA